MPGGDETLKFWFERGQNLSLLIADWPQRLSNFWKVALRSQVPHGGTTRQDSQTQPKHLGLNEAELISIWQPTVGEQRPVSPSGKAAFNKWMDALCFD